MKQFRIFWTGIRAYVSAIHPVDRCLILLAIVLLAQSIYSLFIPEQSVVAGNIDTMVRTSLASVFGYFLSANFNAGSSEQLNQKSTNSPDTISQEEMVLSVASEEPIETQQITEPQETETVTQEELSSSKSSRISPTCSRLQIFLAAGIGLVCLVSLMILHCFPALAEQAVSGSSAATVTQFRDLVSGCIGFLIGCPVHRSSIEP